MEIVRKFSLASFSLGSKNNNSCSSEGDSLTKLKDTLREAIAFKMLVASNNVFFIPFEYYIFEKQLFIYTTFENNSQQITFPYLETLKFPQKFELIKDLVFAVDYLHLHNIVHKKIYTR